MATMRIDRTTKPRKMSEAAAVLDALSWEEALLVTFIADRRGLAKDVWLNTASNTFSMVEHVQVSARKVEEVRTRGMDANIVKRLIEAGWLRFTASMDETFGMVCLTNDAERIFIKAGYESAVRGW